MADDEDLWEQVALHRAHLERDHLLESQRAGRLDDFLARVVAAMVERQVADLRASDRYSATMADVAAGVIDPYRAAAMLLGDA